MFEHGIASGDPTTDAVILWTRVTTDRDSVDVGWEIARDAGFADVVGRGTATAAAAHDHTVHVDAGGLAPATDYWYRFTAGTDESPVGRTRTLPAEADSIRFAYCSCAKYNAGYFNGYGRMADRDDIAFVLHLGDYIYETSNTPPASQTAGADIGRPFDPVGECKTLADYRTRYAQYHSDLDVQRMHARHPIIPTLDDHEFADGAWREGANEHHEDVDGPWASRRGAAFQSRAEWLPIRPPDPNDPTRVFRSVDLAGLAELFLLDIRSRRDRPVKGDAMRDPDRVVLGPDQWAWLRSAWPASTAAWRVLCSPSIITRTWCADPGDVLQLALTKLKIGDETGAVGPDWDQWDGYPAERGRLLKLLATVPNAVILSGDIHVSIAGEVHDDGGEHGEPITVEWTTPSLTSQNLDDKMGWAAGTNSRPAEARMLDALPHIAWCDFDRHGYVVVDIDRDRMRVQWWHVPTVLERVDGEEAAAAFERRQGSPRNVRV